MQDAIPIPRGLRDRFLLMLACAAGAVDALGLLGLGGVFCSALSGNTVLLGAAVVNGHVEEAVLGVMVFLGFVPGAVAGALFLRRVPRSNEWTGRITAAMMIEAGILALVVLGFLLIGSARDTLLLAPLVMLSAFAMGLQYATIVRLNVHGVSTTFVTSTIVNLVWRLTVPEKREKCAQPAADGEGTKEACLSERTNLFLGSIGVAYFIGAVASAALTTLSRSAAALLPFLLVIIIAIYASLITALVSRKGRITNDV